MIYLLQKYEDDTFGYLHIDGDKYENTTTGSKVVLQQSNLETREEFITKNNIEFQNNQYGSNESLDRLVNDGSRSDKIDMAKQGYGLDKLIIIGSKDCEILEPIVDHKYKLDVLLETHYVDRQLAEHGYFLDILINHRNIWVRKAVAEQGYGLDRLINDESNIVRDAAIKKAKELGYDIDISEENNTEVTTTDSPIIKSKLSKESLEFLVEFFEVLSSKNLKTNEQLLDILDKYTDWDSRSGDLKLIDVPDELNDRFKNFLEYINILVTEGTYKAGYANMTTANRLINSTNDYLYSEYDEDDLEDFDIQSEVDDYVLYWVETGIMPEYGGISVKSTKFEDPMIFTEIIKIFELVDEDIEYIQKELTKVGIL